MNDDDVSARIVALEARISHQDLAIEDLNTALTRQWQQIDQLVRQVGFLKDQVREIGEAPGGAGSPDVPPPHY
jgi:SlyX protein